jgi:hypothetical protein
MSRRSKTLRVRLLKYAAWCSFLLFAPHATGSDASGTVRFHSCKFISRYRLDLTRYKGRALDKSNVFVVPNDWVLEHEKGWMAVEGMACAGPWPGDCERLVESRIQILRVTHRWKRHRISGNFAVEFQGGRKLEGSFTAKFKLPPKLTICE